MKKYNNKLKINKKMRERERERERVARKWMMWPLICLNRSAANNKCYVSVLNKYKY